MKTKDLSNYELKECLFLEIHSLKKSILKGVCYFCQTLKKGKWQLK